MPAQYDDDAPEFSLRDMLGMLARRKWIILQAFIFVSVVGAIVATISPPVYGTSAQLLVQTPSGVILNQVASDNVLAPLMMMRQEATVETQIATLRSRLFMDRVRTRLGETSKKWASLDFSPQEATNIIVVSAESGDPDVAAAWANTAAREYVKMTGEMGLSALTGTQDFLKKKKEEAAKQLEDAEQQLMAFRTRTSSPESDEERAIRTQEAVDLETKARDTRNELLSIGTKLAILKKRVAATPRTLTETKVSPNPEAVALREQLSKARTERTVALGTFTPESATIRGMNEQIATLEEAFRDKPLVEREQAEIPNPARTLIESQAAELELQQSALSELSVQLQKSSGNKSGEVQRFAPSQVALSRIQRDRDQAEKTYLDYSEKLRTLDVREKTMEGSAMVLETALPPTTPIRPQKVQQVAVSMILGLLLGLAFALLQEFLDDRVSTSEDVDRLLSLPTLGLVPTITAGEDRLLSSLPDLSRVTESYRSLRLGVQFSSIDTPVRTLVITSPHSGDGKSLTSANLAIALAQEGKRVILVDADLRKPTVHKSFDVAVEPGLTSVLAGQSTVDEVLRKTHVDTLSIICAGPLPPNPPELLNSLAMQSVIEDLKARADIVIFDAPPLLPVTDAQVLAARTDGVIMVIQSGKARKPAVKQASEMLEKARANVLGIVLNKIDQSNKGYHYHYYAHGDYGYTGYYHGAGGDRSARPSLTAAGGSRRSSSLDTLESDGPEVAERPTLPTRLRDWE